MKKIFNHLFCILGYFFLGKLCLLLAIPPGFSSPIWAPIGFACACIFVFGSRTAILGTFLGAFFVNLHYAFPLFSVEQWNVVFLAASIAFGSAVCVWLGSRCIQRYGRLSVPSSRPLHTEKKSILLLLFLGLACSLASSLIGASALVAFKIVEKDFFLLTWAHWWVGDGIGIILIAPIGVMWARLAPDRRSFFRLFQFSLPAVATLACLILVFTLSGNNETRSLAENFHKNAERLAHQVEDDMRLDTEILTALVSFYRGSEIVEEHEFQDFLTGITNHHRYIEQILWIPNPQSKLYKSFYSYPTNNGLFEPLFIKDRISHHQVDLLNPFIATPIQNMQVLVFPVVKQKAFLGSVVGILNTEKLINANTQKSDLQNFEIEFQDVTTQKSSFWRNNSFSNAERKFTSELVLHPFDFQVLDHEWKIEVATTRTELYKEVPRATILNLFFGLVFSFFVSALHLTLYLREQKAENTSA